MAKNKMNVLDWASITLLLIGGINWGLVALNYNIVELIPIPWLVKVIYGLVGISAVYGVIRLFKK